MRWNLKRLTSMLLAAVMCLGMLPTAMASGMDGSNASREVKTAYGTLKQDVWNRPGDGGFVRYTLVRIAKSDLVDTSTDGTGKGKPLDDVRTTLSNAALNADWFITVNGPLQGYTFLKDAQYSTTTNALAYERIVRKNGSVSAALPDLKKYLSDSAGSNKRIDNPCFNNYFDVELPIGGDPLAGLFSSGLNKRDVETVDGVSVIPYEKLKGSTYGDKLLLKFYECATPEQKTQIRQDAITAYIAVNHVETDEAEAAVAGMTNMQKMRTAFGSVGEGFCYRILAEPGRILCYPKAPGSVENVWCLTFRDAVVIAMANEAGSNTTLIPGTGAGRMQYTAIAEMARMIEPKGNEFLMPELESKDGKTGVKHIYQMGDNAIFPGISTSGRLSLPSTVNWDYGEKIVTQIKGSTSFRGYSVGIWSGYQNGVLSEDTTVKPTTLSVTKSVSSPIVGYGMFSVFNVDIDIAIPAGAKYSDDHTGYVTYDKKVQGSNPAGSYTPIESDADGYHHLLYKDVKLADTYSFSLNSEFFTEGNPVGTRVTVTETGACDDMFAYLFPSSVSLGGLSGQSVLDLPLLSENANGHRTMTYEVTSSNKTSDISLDLVNVLVAGLIEKRVTNELLEADGDFEAFDENYEWKMGLYFDRPLDDLFWIKFGASNDDILDSGIASVSGDSFRFGLRHKDRLMFASKTLSKSYATGDPLVGGLKGYYPYFGVEEYNVEGLDAAASAVGKVWSTKYLYDLSGSYEDIPDDEKNAFYRDASGNLDVELTELPLGGSYYRRHTTVLNPGYARTTVENGIHDRPHAKLQIDVEVSKQVLGTATNPNIDPSEAYWPFLLDFDWSEIRDDVTYVSCRSLDSDGHWIDMDENAQKIPGWGYHSASDPSDPRAIIYRALKGGDTFTARLVLDVTNDGLFASAGSEDEVNAILDGLAAKVRYSVTESKIWADTEGINAGDNKALNNYYDKYTYDAKVLFKAITGISDAECADSAAMMQSSKAYNPFLLPGVMANETNPMTVTTSTTTNMRRVTPESAVPLAGSEPESMSNDVAYVCDSAVAYGQGTSAVSRSDVVFTNKFEKKGSLHVVIDWNMDGKSATGVVVKPTYDPGSPINNIIDCGTVTQGSVIRIQNTMANHVETLWSDAKGNYVKAKFKGIYEHADGSGTRLCGPSQTQFEYTVPDDVPNDHLIVLYACWDIDAHIVPETIEIEKPCPTFPGEVENHKLFPVYFDYNYYGGGVTSIEVGSFEVWHRLDSCVIKYDEDDNPYTEHTPTYTSVRITYGFADPHESISAETADGTTWRTSMRNGWVFCGWGDVPSWEYYNKNNVDDWRNEDQTIYYYKSDLVEMPPTDTKTFYAIWIPKDIKWYANGGWFHDFDGYWNGALGMQDGVVDKGVWVDDGQPKTTFTYARIVGARDYVDIMGSKRFTPTREGYSFNGWYYEPDCMVPLQEFETGVQPGRSYFAGWTPDPVYVNYYDTREGGGLITTQEYEYGDVLDLLNGVGNTDGQTFTGWQVREVEGCDMAGMDATSIGALTNRYEFVAANASNGYTPMQKLLVWHPRDNGENSNNLTNHGNPSSIDANGYWTLDLETVWAGETASFTAVVNWDDYSNNDGVRPTELTIGLLSSLNNATVQTHTFRNETGDTWEHKFTGLPITTSDASVEEITYSIYPISYVDCDGVSHEILDTAATSGEISVNAPSHADDSVFTSYRYGINNYMTMSQAANGSMDGTHVGKGENSRIYAGKISFNHDLITTGTDIQFTIQWVDKSDNDGQRPGAVTLVLLADGVPVLNNPQHNGNTGYVSVNPAMCDVSADGNTWTYTFRDYQKFTAGGKAIEYTVAVVNSDSTSFTTAFSENGYSARYLTGSQAKGDPNGVVLSRPIETAGVYVVVSWKDDNNRDNMRPDDVTVSLEALQYNDKTYAWETVQVASKVVTGGKTSGMWSDVFEGMYVNNGGTPIIYKLKVTSDLNVNVFEMADPYTWTETQVGNQVTYRPSVTISHKNLTADIPYTVEWADNGNQDNIRPGSVLVRLWAARDADGESEPIELDRQVMTLTGGKTENRWEGEFADQLAFERGVLRRYYVTVEEMSEGDVYGTYPSYSAGEVQHVVKYVGPIWASTAR